MSEGLTVSESAQNTKFIKTVHFYSMGRGNERVPLPTTVLDTFLVPLTEIS